MEDNKDKGSFFFEGLRIKSLFLLQYFSVGLLSDCVDMATINNPHLNGPGRYIMVVQVTL